MRLASYNVENLFDRAKVMLLDEWSEGREILEDFAEANQILGQQVYSDADKEKLADLLTQLGLAQSDESSYIILRRNRGELLRRPHTGGIEIVANGRADWVGSLELKEAPVNHESMLNTARVIRELKADVLGVVEAESRPVLSQFSKDIISFVQGTPFDHIMLIDGNDTRGIDVGIMTRADFPIVNMISHVDDKSENQNIFSRDCPEYLIQTANRSRLHVLVNHFKSKGYGSPTESNRKRVLQGTRVNEIVKDLLARGEHYIAVIGDLNDTPDSDALDALQADNILTDAFQHPEFDNGGYEGTYGSCTARNKIDYLLLSQDLFAKVIKGGVVRKGMWPGVRPRRWDVFPEVQLPVHAASDHAAIWVDLDI
jgi:endonuclease/exonuclease/phosphatase family metal-dependent hydrolase